MDVPMPLCQLVYLTFLSTAVCSLPEGILEGLPYHLQMDSHNFQHVLSWQAEHDPTVPASYNVLYKDRRSRNWMSAKQCSGLAQLSCELTDEFKDKSTEYCALVQSLGGAQVLNSSVLCFVPFIQTILGPPEVNITSCPNCINVSIKLPTSHFRDGAKLLSLLDIYEELYYNITLKSLDGEHKSPRQKTTEEVFSTVIEELYPSRNYCVSVEVTASLNRHSTPSPWKCVTAEAEAQQVSGMIPKPRNARITSVNLHSILQWDAPKFPTGNVTYTVRSKSINFPGDTYVDVRTKLSVPECDVSSLSAYGDYILQLRAEAGQLHSAWVTLRFKPMDDTVVGPPDVRLKSESGALHVDFSGPFAEHEQGRWSLRHYYGSWSYRILYWKKGSTATELSSASWVTQVDTKHNSEILSQLEPWTVYCVQVQALIPEWNKTGMLSRELCEQTTHNGVTPVWVIVAVLMGSMLVVVTAVTVCFFSSFYLYRLTKHIFCPSYIFPKHLKEFLSKPPSAQQPFPPLAQEELLVCDKLIVISEECQTSDGSGAEASRTAEHPQDSAQGDSGEA